VGVSMGEVVTCARWVAVVAAMCTLIVTASAFAEDGEQTPELSTPSSAEQAEGETQDAGSLSSESENLPERTANSETLSLPNGQLETRIYPDPINYRDEEGNWRPIEEDLQEGGASALANGQNSFDLALPEELDGGAARVSTDEGWVSSELLGTNTDAAEVEDNSASYEADHGDLEFELSSLANGLKEDIVLADPSQPSKFSYLLKASAGLTPQRREDGSIVFLDTEGEQAFVLPAPIMLDSKPGLPAISDAIEYGLEERGPSEWLLTIEADREWIESPERVLPIRLDPTLTVPSPSLDCDYLLYNTTSAKNVGCGSTGFNKLRAQYEPAYKEAVQERERSVLKFDTSSIPSSAIVSEATVGLFAPYEPLNITGIELRRVTQSWDASVTWTKANATTNWTTSGGTFNTEGAEILTSERKELEGWWNFSKGLAPIVQGWVSGTISNQGLLVKLKSEEGCAPPGCTDSWAAFNSSAATDSAKRPYLSVIYGLKPSATTEAASAVGETTATLKGQVNPNGAETKYQFEYGTTTSYGSLAPATAESVGAGTTNVAVSKAISGLKGNTTYHYRVSATNAYGTTPGLDKTLTTPKPPTTTTGGAELVISSATMFGEVNPNGSGTSYQFEFGPTTSYGSIIPMKPTGVGSGFVTVNAQAFATGLKLGTTYHYRLTATNSVGTVYGKDRYFTTPSPPTVVTGPSANTNTTAGTLLGTVNPNQLGSTFYFDYGPTAAYGSKTPSAETNIGSGESPIAVSGPISNLTPNAIYHYRVVAKNGAGTTYGDDRTIIVDQTKPGMTFASTYSAASPNQYGLDIQASDPSSVHSGLKSLTILVNGVVEKTENFSCPQSQCPIAAKISWTHTFSHALDGSDRLTVLTLDDAGNATSVAFDLPSQVVRATSYTANPASGGTKIAEEWTELHTHNSRVQRATETVTRGNAECSESGSKAWCGLVRSESSGGDYSQVSTPISKPLAISEAGVLSLPGQVDFGQSVASGPISEIRESWQNLPPGAGTTYEKLVSNNVEDKADNTAATEWMFWVDSATKLPIKVSRRKSSEAPRVSYFSYDSSVLEAGNLPATFFLLAPPTREQQGCISKGQLGGWSYNEGGMTYPDPRFDSLVNTGTGPVLIRPEGASVDGYDPRAKLTANGVELVAAGPDEQPLHWEVVESPEQSLEASGSSIIVISEGGTPSAIIGSSSPKTMSVVNGAPHPEFSESGDEIVLQSTPGANAEVQAITPGKIEAPCVTKAMVEGAAAVHKEAEAAGVLMSKPASSTAKTTTIGVWVNPHPALSGVSVTDKYGKCNGPSTKTVGSDGHLEWGGCPVGSSVTITAPHEVSAGGVNYVVADSSRTISPPSNGWTISFDYNAQPGSGNPPPPPPAPTPAERVIGLEAAMTSQDDVAEASELEVPPGVDCLGKLTRPYKSDTGDPTLFTAEGAYRFKCHPGTFLSSWFFNWHLDRWDSDAGEWVERRTKSVGGPGPATKMQGPFYISTECRGTGVSIIDTKGKKWRSGGTEYALFENPGGVLPEPIKGYGYKTFPCG
jgi:Disaggregatase related repeat